MIPKLEKIFNAQNEFINSSTITKLLKIIRNLSVFFIGLIIFISLTIYIYDYWIYIVSLKNLEKFNVVMEQAINNLPNYTESTKSALLLHIKDHSYQLVVRNEITMYSYSELENYISLKLNNLILQLKVEELNEQLQYNYKSISFAILKFTLKTVIVSGISLYFCYKYLQSR